MHCAATTEKKRCLGDKITIIIPSFSLFFLLDVELPLSTLQFIYSILFTEFNLRHLNFQLKHTEYKLLFYEKSA